MDHKQPLHDDLNPERDPIEVGVRRCIALNRALLVELREISVADGTHVESLATMMAQTLDAMEAQLINEAEGVAR